MTEQSDRACIDPGRAPRRAPGLQTDCVHHFDDPARFCGAVVTPIFESSLFCFDDYESCERAFAGKTEGYVYTRMGNPTVEHVEQKVARLEGGEAARCFGSGMAAISASILANVRAGAHLVTVDTVYGPARSFIADFLARFGVSATFVEGTDPAEVEAAVTPRTTLFYLESPSSFVFKLQDLGAVAEIAHRHGIVTVIDNSWATPVFQRPLAFGVDIVVHSATKYLAGHSDVLAGVVVSTSERVRKIADAERALLGGILGPFEAWLVLRGLRTLGVRMQRHQASALRVAAFLQSHPKVVRVHYPGLPDFPQRGLVVRQMSGTSGVMSFELAGGREAVRAFVGSLRYFKLGVSWGGYESLVYPPAISAWAEAGQAGDARDEGLRGRASTPGEELRRRGVSPGLVRLSIGLEDVEDLLDDLDHALSQA